jgi:bacterial leucyl aminopeptidase
MKSGLPKLCLLFALCLSLAVSAGPSTKRRAWITIGDAAYRQVKTIAPDAVSVDSRQLPAEKVHAIVVDEGRLAKIAGVIH